MRPEAEAPPARQRQPSTRHYRIVGFYGVRNRGDEVMLSGLIGAVRARRPGAAVSVSSFRLSSADSARYPQVTFFPILVRPLLLAIPATLLLRFLPQVVCRRLLLTLALRSPNLSDVVHAGVLVTAGGPFISEEPRRTIARISLPGLGYWRIFLELEIALTFGRRIVIAGQSIGPLESRLSRWAFRRYLVAAPLVAIREAVSLEHIERLFPDHAHKVEMVPDFALSPTLFGIGHVPAPGAKGERLDVLVNVRSLENVTRYFAPIGSGCAWLEEQFRRYWLRMLTCIAARRSSHFIFVSHSPVEADTALMRRLSEEIVCASDIVPPSTEIISYEAGLERCLAAYRSADIGLVTRYHAAVFAIRAELPFLAFEYAAKVRGLMRMANLDRYAMPVTSLLSDPTRQVNDLLSDPEAAKDRVVQARIRLESSFDRWCDRVCA